MSMRMLIVFSAILIASAGCALERPHAIVNDVSVRQEIDSGYKLVAVDGKKVRRARGSGINSLVDYVPVAWVEPGTHSLTLRRSTISNTDDSASKNEVTITATLEANKSYRVAVKDGTVSLTDDNERTPLPVKR
jgi:hypothetical protein